MPKNIFTQLIQCICLLTFFPSVAQEKITLRNIEISQSIKEKLDKEIKNYQLVYFSSFPKRKEELNFSIQTLENLWEIQLYPNDIRSKDFIIQEFDGKNIITTTLSDIPTFAGTVNGQNARFFISDDFISGTIYLKEDIITLEPLNWTLGIKEFKDVYILYKDSDLIKNNSGRCGVRSVTQQAKEVIPNLQAISSSTLNCKILNVAIEYDWEFNDNYGGYSQAMSIMNNIDYIYYTGIGNRVNVSWIGGWTTSNDPYSNTTLDGNLLGEFINYWQTNRGYVSRNLAHMFTGKDLGSGFPGVNSNGMANLINICSGNSYSLSDRGDGGSDWQYVASHEIGHNLGHGSHDSDYGIDCNATRYIMCTGNNKLGSFSSNAQNIIRSFLSSTECMSTGNTPIISCTLDGSPINSTPYYISSGAHYIYVIDNSSSLTPPIISYSYSPNASIYYSPSGNSCYFYPSGINSFTMQIVASNTCGNTYRGIPFVIYSTYKVFPNPSKDYVAIEFSIDDEPESYQALPEELTIWNENQVLKTSKPQELHKAKSLSSKNNKITFDVKDLERGIYYLNIKYSSEKIEKIRIILE